MNPCPCGCGAFVAQTKSISGPGGRPRIYATKKCAKRVEGRRRRQREKQSNQQKESER